MSVNMKHTKRLVFSGMQPTGNLHLGNYLGAIKNWIALQDEAPCIYCIVDLHALTIMPDPNELKQSIRTVAAAYLAAGIDAKQHIVYNQSKVRQHSELAWVFNCVARVGWMSRMTQFKEKAGKNREKASLGLFAYPSLMAADISLYRASHVPVGHDQTQHIELSRDISQKFNNDYKEQIQALNLGNLEDGGFFPLVEPILNQTAMRIMSLRDGTKKMSKSDPSDLSRINLDDTADMITQKIRKAKTDSGVLPDKVEDLAGRPEADNLLGIFAALANIEKASAVQQFAGKNFSDLKADLIELLVAELTPIASELRKLQAAPDYIDDILKDGAERASYKAEETLKSVRDIVGFL